MGKYILRRILWLGLVLLAVSFITFSLMHLVPGGPWDREKELAPQIVENLNIKYGLDKPFYEQYINYVWNALHGDLGVSYKYQDRSVTEIIGTGLPITATLGVIAFILALVIGIPLGMAAALKQNSVIDYVAVVFSTVFASIPGFVLGILLVIIFSVWLHWLPTSGWGDWRQIIMPAFSLAALPAAYTARITRASMLEVVRQDYIRTARAKGLSERIILSRHTLRNALIPVVTVAGPELAFLIAGSFIIENIFSIPGVGRLFVQGVFARDYGLIMGTILFYAFAVAIINLIVDIMYGWIDPRIRYD
ncbi:MULTISPECIES: ABC transporter permease [Dehalococcoides]|jgi:oligopeptide transport system permease protein|uniref:Oligopeptide transport system permease protein n=2 Tax=Dehalococcoides mccartyi TaxID=61435 RepID=A0A142VAG7_9CHLR|nr:ABC transporter permease [Dehalococcoides mccartyi]AGG06598.1 PepT transporter family, permease [Dehalococcoides mccartyi DCMB5]AGG08091.1 PepT transporter family, permease [Dehalococcoides mccartyi BTF08]AII61103.1 peptide ABC transporter permease [Dehalococcoides mccartyi CG5]AMU86788.1 oligopeptide transport system permease protein [Dehalococcoides mccartyi]AOV99577.1 oligopeptide transport system permease protein OppB [Dehalococcoides mccartyi]